MDGNFLKLVLVTWWTSQGSLPKVKQQPAGESGYFFCITASTPCAMISTLILSPEMWVLRVKYIIILVEAVAKNSSETGLTNAIFRRHHNIRCMWSYLFKWSGYETCQTPLVYVFVSIVWTWLCKTFNSIPINLNLLTNRNISLIYSVTICEQRTKDFAQPGSFSHELRHRCFQLWCLPAFITSFDVIYILIRYPAQTNIKHLSCNKQPQLGCVNTTRVRPSLLCLHQQNGWEWYNKQLENSEM